MFVFAEAIDLTTPFIQALPFVIKTLWPFAALMLAIVFIRDVAPRLLGNAKSKRKQAKWFEAQRTITDIQNLKPKEFEQFVAVLFGKMGFSAKTTSYTKDGGIDVIALKDGKQHFIQCKKYITSKATLPQVRDFYGAMADAGCSRGFFVTTGFFTLDAEQFAAGKQIELINGERLMEYFKRSNLDLKATVAKPGITAVQETEPTFVANDGATPAAGKLCPKCGSALVVRTARKGPHAGAGFWGCSGFPKCRFTAALS